MTRLGLAVTIGLAIASAPAQSPDMSATRAGFDAFDRGDYLAADRLLRAGLDVDGSIRDEAAFQTWDQIHPMLTGEVPVGGLRPVKGLPPAPDPSDLSALAAARPREAIAEIVRRARSTGIVILNEAHDSPRDRAFALEVARAAAARLSLPGCGDIRPTV